MTKIDKLIRGLIILQKCDARVVATSWGGICVSVSDEVIQSDIDKLVSLGWWQNGDDWTLGGL